MCGNSVSNMYQAYYCCNNITGNAACGDNVINMAFAYYNCRNLNGSSACGNHVSNISYAYYTCYNLTGEPKCRDQVLDMSYAYYQCSNLNGSAACGKNVVNMAYAYYNCSNLTNAICGASVQNMAYAYYYCTNIQGNFYIYSNVVHNVYRCLRYRSTSNRLNVYVHANTTSNTTVMQTSSSSIAGYSVTWTNDYVTNGCYYNTTRNIYIYPVANVEEARKLNGD
jgi:hypothetical protein